MIAPGVTAPAAYPAAVARFEVLAQRGPYTVVRCPVKGHTTARAALWVGRDGRLMYGCWGGCDKASILRAVGLEGRHMRQPIAADPNAPKPRVVARYPYRDERGTLLFMGLRWEPGHNGSRKSLSYRRPARPGDDPAKVRGGWVSNADGCRRVLYRLPELLAADPSRTVLVVEGEKDVDALRAAGCVATCNPFGAGQWRAEYGEWLQGRRVAVVADQDEAGLRHAALVVGLLADWPVRSLRKVGMPEKDAADYLAALRRAGVTEPARVRRALAGVVGEYPEWGVLKP